VHGRVVFVGDAAHQVSPFGARGANSGIQDAENLAWKLAAVLQGRAPASLIGSYDLERGQAADENIAHSTRSTSFIAPHSEPERILRDAVLSLAPHAEFARRMVNSGRLSVATAYRSPLSTPDIASFAGTAGLGAPVPDAPMQAGDHQRCHLLDRLPWGFTLLAVPDGITPMQPPVGATLVSIGEDLQDVDGLFAQRFDATPGAAYLLRPDHHLCARWRRYDSAAAEAALARASGRA